MTLDKIIYIASIVGRLRTTLVLATGGTILVMVISVIKAITEDWIEDKRKFYTKQAKKFLALTIILSIICVFIPSRNEMFSMFLTKGYQKEEIYKMTKEELKENIDYLVNSLEKIGDKND